MSTADFAAFSDNAIMFASIVYVLAFLAHLTEWVFLRSLPVPAATVADREPVAVGGGAPRRSRTAVPSPTTRWRHRSCGWRSGAASGSR